MSNEQYEHETQRVNAVKARLTELFAQPVDGLNLQADAEKIVSELEAFVDAKFAQTLARLGLPEAPAGAVHPVA